MIEFAFILIIAVGPIMLWLVAEITKTRVLLRILAGFLALGMTALIVQRATDFEPAHERALLGGAMLELENTLKQGNTNVACQAVAAYNQAASTGGAAMAAGLLMQRIRQDGEQHAGPYRH